MEHPTLCRMTIQEVEVDDMEDVSIEIATDEEVQAMCSQTVPTNLLGTPQMLIII